MKVYITSNRYQNLAAKVAAYSFSRFGYETQIINVEDFDKIKSNFNSTFKNIDIHYISSVTMNGITKLKDMIWKKLN